MGEWQGPGTPFTILADGDDTTGLSLPAQAQDIYGDWRLFLRSRYVRGRADNS